jgi:putative ABC transport system permease protein
LPYKDSSKVVFLLGENKKQNRVQFTVGLPDIADWKDQNRVFDEVSAYVASNVDLSGIEQPERLQGYSVTPNTFPLLGVQPMLGRTFLPEEGKGANNRVVVLSFALWAKRFGSQPDVIGRTIRLNGENHTVIGFMPRSFEYPQFNFKGDLWTPLSPTPDMLKPSQRGYRFFVAVARLRNSVTLAQAQTNMDGITGRLAAQYPDTDSGWGTKVVPIQQMLIRPLAPALAILVFLVGIVLLIACTNVANLLLARAVDREKEIAVRIALGASRRQLIGQLLTESLLLALFGGAGGVVLALAGVQLLSMKIASIQFLADTDPALLGIGIDRVVLVFSLIVSMLTGVVFGLIPALRGSKSDLNRTLKESTRSLAGSPRQRLRSLLVVLELAFSLPLLVCVSLMIRSFVNVVEVNPGFDTRQLLTIQLSLPERTYKEDRRVIQFFKLLTERIGVIPGVQKCAIVNNLPLSTSGEPTQFSVDGQVTPSGPDKAQLDLSVVTPGYFETMAIPILKGRQFTASDGSDGQPVAIINQTLAQRYFKGKDPIGQTIRFTTPKGDRVAFPIIGLASNVRHWGLTTEPEPQAYVSFLQTPRRAMTIVVRTSIDPLAVASTIRSEIRDMDPEQAAFNVKTMNDIISSSLVSMSFPLSLMAVFALLALVLAVVGVYGLISNSTAQRSHEFGVRLALGAQRADILKLEMKRGLRLIGTGIGIGLLAGWGVAVVIHSVLYGISAVDPFSFLASTTLLLGAATFAIYLPASRATRIDPINALRHE